MKKSVYKELVLRLSKTKRGFMKLVPNPAGTKFRNACLKTTRRGVDGTMR